ncbi:LacI family DNA-binding transcriptional regulator [Georgenia deserti]|uniref:LacI family DNA-binding transcriptional regulator n=1 Tax=Georgenia deserti TaxID=2093781 RepID=A0ABW4L490_9MICO|nr:LacI family DNA-binding transcriptional regulator [Micromonosporaceae bacterium]
MTANIHDVAAAAGVSIATVSRVYNGQRVSPDRAARVREAAKQLDFSPNRAARSLRRKHSEVIALIVPDIENPYFTAMARGVEDSAQRAGYSVVLGNTDDEEAKESQYLRIAVSENMAGVIVVPNRATDDLLSYVASGRPAVAIDRQLDLGVDEVLVDNVAAGRLATGALLDAGFERVGLVTGPPGLSSANDRVIGWRAAHGERGLEVDETLVEHGDFRVAGAREAMRALLGTGAAIDAVVAGNNLTGIGAFQVLARAGTVPPDFGFAIIGDLPFTTMVSADIVRIDLPARQVGIRAADMLIDRITGHDGGPRSLTLPPEVLAADHDWTV